MGFWDDRVVLKCYGKPFIYVYYSDKNDDHGINRRVSVHIMGAKTGINPLHIY